jgi:hypothetical protein
MGGKIWSADEEMVFWTIIIPKSPKRLGADMANQGLGWDELAAEMLAIMPAPRRREYTGLSLC